jgi:hypothetical protein
MSTYKNLFAVRPLHGETLNDILRSIWKLKTNFQLDVKTPHSEHSDEVKAVFSGPTENIIKMIRYSYPVNHLSDKEIVSMYKIMESKLIRIPSNVPNSVIAEAVKRHLSENFEAIIKEIDDAFYGDNRIHLTQDQKDNIKGVLEGDKNIVKLLSAGWEHVADAKVADGWTPIELIIQGGDDVDPALLKNTVFASAVEKITAAIGPL